MTIPLQFKLKSPAGTFPSESGLTINVYVLSKTTNCVLRHEQFSGASISNGHIFLNLGSGTLSVLDPALSLNEVFDNSTSKSGLSCIDSNNAVVSTGQTYSPAWGDDRTVRIVTTVAADSIVANFPLQTTPYAIQAESVGGKHGSLVLVSDVTTQLSQTNLADLLFDLTRFNNLKNFAISGQAPSAVTATTAVSSTNFSGLLSGDVTGNQTTSSVVRIRGTNVSATSPTTGQVLIYDGSQYVPQNLPAAPVTSVAGKTGAVSLVVGDVSGLGGAALLNVGTVASTVAAGDDSRITNAIQNSTVAAGDASGTFSTLSVDRIKGVSVSATPPVQNQALVYNGTNWVPTNGFPYFVSNSADQTFSTTAQADATNLSFPVVASRKYKFKFQVFYTSAATTTGVRLGLTAPASTLFSSQASIPVAADGTASFFQGTINSSGDSVMSTGTPAATTIHTAFIEGQIIPSAAGVVQLRVASEVNASNIVLKNGSFVEIIERP